jgi:serine/threonine-protein kinase
VADTVPGLLAMIVADAPPLLSTVRPDAPGELEAAILRCLQKDREQRFANVAVLAHALERFASPEVRPLVRRISRVLGAQLPEPRDARVDPSTMTAPEVGVQTHNTWARTGRLNDVASLPFYARPALQLGAGMGLVGVGLVAWLLLSRGASLPQGPLAAPAPAAAQAGHAAPAPAAVKPIAPKLEASPLPPAREAAQTPAAGVHPVREVDPSPPPRAEPLPNGDDDPRAARNFRDDATVYPSASAKKKELAAAARKRRRRPTPARAVKPPPAEPARETRAEHEPAPAAAAPAKKSDTLNDLFNDTK